MVLSFEEFLVKKDQEKAFFFCLLGDEKKYLEGANHWVNNAPFSTYIVRLSEDEFNMLHVGKHPKVFLYDKGREVKAWNGIPEYETLLEEL